MSIILNWWQNKHANDLTNKHPNFKDFAKIYFAKLYIFIFLNY